MANGIKLRRGLKTALAGTIADGEFVFCTDSGELGFKKGTVEKYVDLEKLSTDIDDIQDSINELQVSLPVLLPGQFKFSINKYYDFVTTPASKPANNGKFRIPIAQTNNLFISNRFELIQVIYFNRRSLVNTDVDGYGVLTTLNNLSLDYIVIKAVDTGYSFLFDCDEYNSSTDLDVFLDTDGYGNTTIYLELAVMPETISTRIDFDVNCVSVQGKDSSNVAYSVFLPPTDLNIIKVAGAT